VLGDSEPCMDEEPDWLRDSTPSALAATTAGLSPKGSPSTSGGSPDPSAVNAGKSPESVSIASLDLEPAPAEEHSG
jgi:hypothetical protein